jgi:hypothetical protein
MGSIPGVMTTSPMRIGDEYQAGRGEYQAFRDEYQAGRGEKQAVRGEYQAGRGE